MRTFFNMTEFLDLGEKANLFLQARGLLEKTELAIMQQWTISPGLTRALCAHSDSYERENPLVPALRPTGS
ncbi:MAG: hypothetical protein QOH24_2308 [Verrucomicrobiota bacterium]|jgi:hypothetical protein